MSTVATSTAQRGIRSLRPNRSSRSNGRLIPPTLWNQFGGSIGGPIQRDKTFFFGDYQANRQHNGDSVLTRVPTAAERTGDLSGLGISIYNPCNGDGLQYPAGKPPAVFRERDPFGSPLDRRLRTF